MSAFSCRLITLILLSLVPAGCTWTRKIGSRGDATLYHTQSLLVPVYPYRIEFDQTPLDRVGGRQFVVRDLDEAYILHFHLAVGSSFPLVHEQGSGLGKPPLNSAGFRTGIVKIKITGERGPVLLEEKLSLGENAWFMIPGLKGYKIDDILTLKHPEFVTGNFRVSLEVTAPSTTKGDYITINGIGVPSNSGIPVQSKITR